MLCPAGLHKKQFDKVMNHCWEKTDKDKYPFMHVNMKNTLDKRFMKNFTEFINIDKASLYRKRLFGCEPWSKCHLHQTHHWNVPYPEQALHVSRPSDSPPFEEAEQKVCGRSYQDVISFLALCVKIFVSLPKPSTAG
jgi:hypothetical protein